LNGKRSCGRRNGAFLLLRPGEKPAGESCILKRRREREIFPFFDKEMIKTFRYVSYSGGRTETEKNK
jgi:hypothetical protein